MSDTIFQKRIAVFLFVATTFVMGQHSVPAEDSWLINTASCPIQLSLKETFHGVVATNRAVGTVVRYQLACFRQTGKDHKLVKRLDFMFEEMSPNQFVMLSDQKYWTARVTCKAVESQVGVSQVSFADGAVWLADATLQPAEPSR